MATVRRVCSLSGILKDDHSALHFLVHGRDFLQQYGRKRKLRKLHIPLFEHKTAVFEHKYISVGTEIPLCSNRSMPLLEQKYLYSNRDLFAFLSVIMLMITTESGRQNRGCTCEGYIMNAHNGHAQSLSYRVPFGAPYFYSIFICLKLFVY